MGEDDLEIIRARHRFWLAMLVLVGYFSLLSMIFIFDYMVVVHQLDVLMGGLIGGIGGFFFGRKRDGEK